MAQKKSTATSRTIEELDAAFIAEGITIRDLVKTMNDTRTSAQRFSTKDGEAVGPDHATRFKAAESLLALRGLPAKGAPPDTAATPARIQDLIGSDAQTCQDLGL